MSTRDEVSVDERFVEEWAERFYREATRLAESEIRDRMRDAVRDLLEARGSVAEGVAEPTDAQVQRGTRAWYEHIGAPVSMATREAHEECVRAILRAAPSIPSEPEGAANGFPHAFRAPNTEYCAICGYDRDAHEDAPPSEPRENEHG